MSLSGQLWDGLDGAVTLNAPDLGDRARCRKAGFAGIPPSLFRRCGFAIRQDFPTAGSDHCCRRAGSAGWTGFLRNSARAGPIARRLHLVCRHPMMTCRRMPAKVAKFEGSHIGSRSGPARCGGPGRVPDPFPFRMWCWTFMPGKRVLSSAACRPRGGKRRSPYRALSERTGRSVMDGRSWLRPMPLFSGALAAPCGLGATGATPCRFDCERACPENRRSDAGRSG